MKRKIEEVLIKIGVPCANLGFEYITESILILEEKEIKFTDLYAEVAKRYNTTSQRVERNIRTCLSKVRKNFDDYDLVDYYIGFKNCENSNSLCLLRYRINSEMESEE